VHSLISYFLSNTSAKNYRNRIMCVKIIASQTWDIFETVYSHIENTYVHTNEPKHSETGRVRQNPIQRTVRSVHVCVCLCVVLSWVTGQLADAANRSISCFNCMVRLYGHNATINESIA